MKNILIISPHLDDEILGVAGTLLYHLDKGDKVYWINVTLPDDDVKKSRRLSEQKKVNTFFKFENSYQLNFASTTLEGKIDQLISAFAPLFNEIEPNIVYLPNRSDVHSDHRVIFKAAYSCTKSFRYPFIEKVLMYETLSETEFAPPLLENVFNPNVFVDVTKYMDQKIEAMKIYKEELMTEEFPRSIEAIKSLAHYRGVRTGCKYAEAFMLLYQKIN